MKQARKVEAVRDGATILQVMSAEKHLANDAAKSEVEEWESVVPEGHPIRQEIARVKGLVGNDLSLIPKGHPLRLMVERFKRQKDGEEPKTELQPRRLEASRQEEAEQADYRTAMKVINSAMSSAFTAIEGVNKAVNDNEDALAKSQHRARVMRLKRFLMMTQKALVDFRLN